MTALFPAGGGRIRLGRILLSEVNHPATER